MMKAGGIQVQAKKTEGYIFFFKKKETRKGEKKRIIFVTCYFENELY